MTRDPPADADPIDGDPAGCEDRPASGVPEPAAGPEPPGRGEVVEALMAAGRAFVDVAARSLAGLDTEVTLTQFRTLVVMAGRGPQRAVDVATELGVSPSTGTRMCDRLVRKGLIRRTRRTTDRRVVRLALTAAGRRLVAEVTRRRRRELGRLIEAIPPGRYPALVEMLGAISEAAARLPEAGRGVSTPPDRGTGTGDGLTD